MALVERVNGMSIAAALLYVIVIIDRRLNRWEGAFLLLFYVFFILKLFELF